MNPKKTERNLFSGCVEILPPLYPDIHFVGSDESWTFSRSNFLSAALTENAERRSKKTQPPDILKIYFSGSEVALKGWRLKPVMAALMSGHLIRVHAEKLLGNLILDQPWVSEIQVCKHSFGSPTKP